MLTAVAALVPMVLALVLIAIPSIKRLFSRKKPKKADPMEALELEEDDMLAGLPELDPQPASEVQPAPPVEQENAEEEEESGEDEGNGDDKKPVDDVLLSVFTEEEEDGYYDMILTGLETPSAEEVADLGANIMEQLRSRVGGQS